MPRRGKPIHPAYAVMRRPYPMKIHGEAGMKLTAKVNFVMKDGVVYKQ